MEELPSVLGLIAGEGRFPFLVLEEAKRRGVTTVTLGIKGSAEAGLADVQGEGFHWVALGALSRAVGLLREAGARQAVMAGRVQHVRAFDILRPDRLMVRVLARLRSRSTADMLATLAEVLGEEGVELVDSTGLLREHLARAGDMAKRRGTKAELESARFGAAKARELARLDVGQTVVVKNKAIVCAEAMEGTDAAIRRAAEITEGPFVVVKVARPKQDMRFDVPVVGPETIASMKAAGATLLGLEAGRVLFLDKDAVLDGAAACRIAVHGVEL